MIHYLKKEFTSKKKSLVQDYFIQMNQLKYRTVNNQNYLYFYSLELFRVLSKSSS